MKTILKFGAIFSIIYVTILIMLTFFEGRLMPAELYFIVPLWLLVRPLLADIASLPSNTFMTIVIVVQLIAAFVQGAVVGLIVNIFAKNK